ncbi:hypothetical protein Hdeb2414_s0313g00864791 [Helianthus debilis subsp. tardiflorus]
MNFLSLNIRDMEGGEKEAWVKDIKTKHGLNYLALQETKVVITAGKQFTCSRDNGKNFAKLTGCWCVTISLANGRRRALELFLGFSRIIVCCCCQLSKIILGPNHSGSLIPGLVKTGSRRWLKGSFHDSGPADSFLSKKLPFIRNHIKRRDDMLLKEREVEVRALEEIENLEEALEERELEEEEAWALWENKKVLKQVEQRKKKGFKTAREGSLGD